jgi:hypothetical protein
MQELYRVPEATQVRQLSFRGRVVDLAATGVLTTKMGQ